MLKIVLFFVALALTDVVVGKPGSGRPKPQTNSSKPKPGRLNATPVYAHCALRGSGVTGNVDFMQKGNELQVLVNISGVGSNEKHGFHVHQLGDMSNGCLSTGGHYNPLGKNHGAPGSEERHVGDLGNVMSDSEGFIGTVLKDKVARLTGQYSIIGRAIVLHAGQDDLGKGGLPGSLKTGNAGSRLACCIIGRTEGTRSSTIFG